MVFNMSMLMFSISLAVSEHIRSQCLMLQHSSGIIEHFQSFTPDSVCIVTLTSHVCIHFFAPVSISQLICAFKAHFSRSASARTETPSLKYKKHFFIANSLLPTPLLLCDGICAVFYQHYLILISNIMLC